MRIPTADELVRLEAEIAAEPNPRRQQELTARWRELREQRQQALDAERRRAVADQEQGWRFRRR